MPLLTFSRSAVKSCALSSCSETGLSGHSSVSLNGGEGAAWLGIGECPLDAREPV